MAEIEWKGENHARGGFGAIGSAGNTFADSAIIADNHVLLAGQPNRISMIGIDRKQFGKN